MVSLEMVNFLIRFCFVFFIRATCCLEEWTYGINNDGGECSLLQIYPLRHRA